MKRKIIIGIASIIIVVAIITGIKGISYYNKLKEYKQQVANINISSVDLNKVPDGTYTGNCEVIWVAAKVKVTVKNHKITDIELVEHINGKGEPAEVIPDRVVNAQSLQVDTVSGVTSSCKVILKAIENALNSSY